MRSSVFPAAHGGAGAGITDVALPKSCRAHAKAALGGAGGPRPRRVGPYVGRPLPPPAPRSKQTLSCVISHRRWAGGIGVHVSNVRGKGSRIASTNGTSDGIIPMLKVFNETARYCNQSGRRKGSIAIYLEPW